MMEIVLRDNVTGKLMRPLNKRVLSVQELDELFLE